MTQRETPLKLAQSMVEMLDLRPGQRLLEPSAGIGNLLRGFIPNMDLLEKCNVTCVELNYEKIKILTEFFSPSLVETIHHGDFLSIKFDHKFDRILMAPPFKNHADLEHITRAYDLLDTHSSLVSLTSPHWTCNNEPQQVKFREWLSTKITYQMRMCPDNTFIEKGKSVPTAIIKITKHF